MLMKLNPDNLYDVVQHIGRYVLTGEDCECDDMLTKVVCGQLKSVIDRKGRKSNNSANNLRRNNGANAGPATHDSEPTEVKPQKPSFPPQNNGPKIRINAFGVPIDESC